MKSTSSTGYEPRALAAPGSRPIALPLLRQPPRPLNASPTCSWPLAFSLSLLRHHRRILTLLGVWGHLDQHRRSSCDFARNRSVVFRAPRATLGLRVGEDLEGFGLAVVARRVHQVCGHSPINNKSSHHPLPIHPQFSPHQSRPPGPTHPPSYSPFRWTVVPHRRRLLLREIFDFHRIFIGFPTLFRPLGRTWPPPSSPYRSLSTPRLP